MKQETGQIVEIMIGELMKMTEDTKKLDEIAGKTQQETFMNLKRFFQEHPPIELVGKLDRAQLEDDFYTRDFRLARLNHPEFEDRYDLYLYSTSQYCTKLGCPCNRVTREFTLHWLESHEAHTIGFSMTFDGIKNLYERDTFKSNPWQKLRGGLTSWELRLRSIQDGIQKGKDWEYSALGILDIRRNNCFNTGLSYQEAQEIVADTLSNLKNLKGRYER